MPRSNTPSPAVLIPACTPPAVNPWADATPPRWINCITALIRANPNSMCPAALRPARKSIAGSSLDSLGENPYKAITYILSFLVSLRYVRNISRRLPQTPRNMKTVGGYFQGNYICRGSVRHSPRRGADRGRHLTIAPMTRKQRHRCNPERSGVEESKKGRIRI